MCGLVGLLTKYPLAYKINKVDIFSEMLFVDQLRGFDSTGICLVDQDNNLFKYKRAMAASDFLTTRQFSSMARKVDPHLLMGHNRSATKGVIVDDNAHPFTVGNITLMHNGTLTNHKSLRDGVKFEVDSHYIAYSIHHFGVEETLKHIEGAFALTWYNQETKMFHVAKNSQRTLTYAYVGDYDNLVYASEGEMLMWILARNHKTVKDGWFSDFEDGFLYTIDPKNPEHMTKQEMELYKPKVYQPIKKYLPKVNLPGGTGENTNIGNTLNTPEDALAKLGYSLDSKLTLEVEDILTNKRYVEFSLIKPNNAPVDADVICRHYYTSTAQEHEYYDNIDNHFVATIRSCVHIPGTNQYIIYLMDIEEIIETDQLAEQGDDFELLGEDIAKDLAMFPGPGKTWISGDAFNKRVEGGCVQCTGNVALDDADYTTWTEDGRPICHECTQDWIADQIHNGYME